MRTIAIVNHKGGIGKTSSVAALGEEFASMGLRTLLVDLDAQANLTAIVGGQGSNYPRTILDAFRERKDLPTYKIREDLYLCPSCLDFAGVEMELASAMGREYILKTLLEDIEIKKEGGKYFDLCLLDCPPSLGSICINALIAADGGEIFVPLTPETLPYLGLTAIDKVCGQVRAALRQDGVRISGLFFTKVERTSISAEIMEKVRQTYGPKVFETYIRKNVSVTEAPLSNLPLREYAPSSNASKDYHALAEEIVRTWEEEKQGRGRR